MTQINTRQEFLERLRWRLSHLPDDQIEDILYDYEEHFQIGLERGETEEEIIRKLGNPASIAAQYKFEQAIDLGEGKFKSLRLIRAMGVGIGLGFFNLIFVLGFYLAAVGIIFGMFVAGLALSVGGIFLVAAGIFPGMPFVSLPFLVLGTLQSRLALVFAGIGSVALGLLIMIAFYWLGARLYRWTLRYLQRSIDMVKKAGGGE